MLRGFARCPSYLPAVLAVVLLAAALAFAPVAPAAAAEGGLDLKSTEKTVESYDSPNPHFDLECSECHDGNPSFKTDTAATVKFLKGDDGQELGNVALCYKCHDPADNIHPINVDPTKGIPPVVVPKVFPLETRGPNKGQVVCSSCHFIHTKTAGLKMLRGFPESSGPDDMKKAQFKDRREMCRGCHGSSLEKKTPHKGIDGDPKSCAFCHAVAPKKGEKIEFSKGLIELCDFCHAATKGAHYLLVNPFADPNLKDEIGKANVPMLDGQFTCVSCHDPHGGTKEPKYLRDAFVALALKSARIRPHFQQSFCLACHKVKPKAPKGSPEAQKLSEIPLLTDDANALCNRCHESGLSKANAHPLKKVEGKFLERHPKDWPLQNGELTCLSCHTAGDSPVMDKDNPNFVRGAPYATRNEMCWKCHLREEFQAINPHLDINSGEGCTFCHDTKPDMKKSVDIEKLRMKGDIIMLCIRCHDDTPHPAGFNHVGLFDAATLEAKKIKIPKDYPLDSRGRMTCATCHNPHAGGDKRGVVVGMEICSACHPF